MGTMWTFWQWQGRENMFLYLYVWDWKSRCICVLRVCAWVSIGLFCQTESIYDVNNCKNKLNYAKRISSQGFSQEKNSFSTIKIIFAVIYFNQRLHHEFAKEIMSFLMNYSNQLIMQVQWVQFNQLWIGYFGHSLLLSSDKQQQC